MKLVKPSVEYWGKAPTDLAGNLALIERAGRLCYKSEDKIGCSIRDPREFTPDYCSDEGRWNDVNGGPARCDAGCRHHSAQKFVRRLHEAGHTAMLEHSNFVVRCGAEEPQFDPGILPIFMAENKFLTYKPRNGGVYIGGNLTAWLHAWEKFDGSYHVMPFYNLWGDFFKLVPKWEPVEGFEPVDEYPKELERHTVKFTCDRGVSHELVRHRLCSFAQESTRYVNYGDKNMEFIEPWWWDEEQSVFLKAKFDQNLEASEILYKDFIAYGRPPQAARAVLPNALKTEIVVTADLAEWNHIFKLRTHPSAHPDMVRVMKMAKEAMGYAVA